MIEILTMWDKKEWAVITGTRFDPLDVVPEDTTHHNKRAFLTPQ